MSTIDQLSELAPGILRELPLNQQLDSLQFAEFVTLVEGRCHVKFTSMELARLPWLNLLELEALISNRPAD